MRKKVNGPYALLKKMTTNSYQWHTKTSMAKKLVGVHELDAFTNMLVKVYALTHCLATMNSQGFTFDVKS